MTKSSYETTRPSLSDIKADVLGAGFHLLSGAGGDLKQLVQQAANRLMGDAYVCREENDALATRVKALEMQIAKKPAKTGAKTPVRKTSKARK